MKLILHNQTAGFEPQDFGFVYLHEHHDPLSGLDYYEYANHPKVDGSHSLRRCNLYLATDEHHAHCWYGYLESIITVGILKHQGIDVEDHLLENRILFHGSIDSKERAEHVFQAINPACWSPTELRINRSKNLIIHSLTED